MNNFDLKQCGNSHVEVEANQENTENVDNEESAANHLLPARKLDPVQNRSGDIFFDTDKCDVATTEVAIFTL